MKKQQKVESELGEIHAGVRAIQSPLLPCGLFFTLRLSTTHDVVERVFGKEEGFLAYGSDRPMPPPPFGLPPGMQDGRLHAKNKYLDYCNGVLVAGGVCRVDHPGFNTIHCDAQQTVCHLSGNRLSGTSEPILSQPLVHIELYFRGNPTQKRSVPSLTLSGNMANPVQIIDAFVFDNEVFVNYFIPSLSATPPEVSSWSSRDLNDAFIRVTLDFLYIEGLFYLPQESWPKLHNLQLWLGEKSRQTFAFSVEQLNKQIIRENPEKIVSGHAICPQIFFEYEIDSGAFSKGLFSVG